jgi:endonuclease-3
VLPPPPSAAFAVYVWEVLSVGTTAVRRDAAFNALRRLPALTPDSLARVPQATLDAAVAHAGAMKEERMRALRAGADLFRRSPSLPDDLAGPFGQAVRAAKRVPHLGRASMLRLLLFSGGHRVLPLDEAALRVAGRLGYGEQSTRAIRVLRTTRQAIVAESGRDPEALRAISQYLTHHGHATCLERAPHCTVCPLAVDCVWLKLQ